VSNLREQPEIRVVLNDVARHYGPRRVFEGVRGEIRTGQVGVITGPNGAGKSTLLRIIAGLLPASSGTVSIYRAGRSLTLRERRACLGYVAPDLTLYKELTGAENLQFFARLRGRSLNRDDLIALLTRVGLRGRGRDLVAYYSSGMRQRLKYALALLDQPPLLLLDEPTVNLDVDGVAIVEEIIAAQRTRPGGGLTILATNEPREVAWGDTVFALSALS
jgi:heme exporter protein A